MDCQNYRHVSRLPVAAEDAYAWHGRPGALTRLLPPWQAVRIVSHRGGIEPGARVELQMRFGPLPVRWVAEHGPLVPGRQFSDRQLRGPFAYWYHTHRFEPLEPQTCELQDVVEYCLPLGAVGRGLLENFVARQLQQTFAYRHTTTRDDLTAHSRYRDRPALDVWITGASGLLGSVLVPMLSAGGHRVTALRREADATAPRPGWNPTTGELRNVVGRPVDALVHLAGESLASQRWNERQKARIRDSRLDATRRLCEGLVRLPEPPKTLICASAIGYYGDRGDAWLDENSPAGSSFLADVCRRWEEATQPATRAGIRVVLIRLGIVLSPRGGALAQLLRPFRLGVGGPLGSGEQYWSWISVDDAVGAIHHVLMNPELRGPINLVAPAPVTNAAFTHTLARILGRPAFVPAPAPLLRLALGELADALLLASARVQPAQLVRSGYSFRQPELEGALRHLLGRA